MSDAPNPPVAQAGGDPFGISKLVYILYFIGFVNGITTIAGVIVAYLKRGESTPAAASHLTFLIRTFWIGLLFAVVGAVTMMIMIGMLILLATVVWALIRLIKGIMLAMDGKPVPDPETWLW
ncbi:MAG: hypothetical protein Q8J92_01565 [Parvibaculum sp.]|nr:hypothetical protein [Parvibaculum sp.]